jgi:DNA repair exonuclease SbcCD nuclease subunit
MVYSGSLERYDFNEKDEKKGFVIYDGDPEFVPIPVRDMVDREVDCSGKTAFEITGESMIVLEDISDKIVRLILKGKMDPLARKDIDFAGIRDKAKDAMHFLLKDTTVIEEFEEIKDEEIVYSPQEELKRYLETIEKKEALSEGFRIMKEIIG